MQEEKKELVFSLSLLSVLLLIAAVATLVATSPTATRAQPSTAVIFRLDDVQDNFASNGTKAVMDLFMQKKVPLTTAIIASAIGKDPVVTQTTSEGMKEGLFEPALHGYKHVDYTTLSPNNQSVSITQGNTVLKKLFNVHPFIFVPPFNTFNTATLSAMRQHDMNILSSTLGTESLENSSKEIYNVNDMHNCGTSESGVTCPNNNPVHLSAGNDFRIITDTNITQQSNPQILKEIGDNVGKYGYSILVLHPQDFVVTDAKTGKVLQNEVNLKQIQQLSTLLDQVKKTYTPTSMGELIKSTGPAPTSTSTSTNTSTTSKLSKVVFTTPAQTFGAQPVNTQPKKVVILTFDDDWVGQYNNAIPILKENGFNATFFVTCQGPIQQAPDFVRGKSPEITTWDQVLSEKQQGFDIQNHGMTHHSLVAQPASVLQREIVDSKTCLEQHLAHNWKNWKATVFAAAYAAPRNNDTVNSYIDKAGYKFARIGYGGGDFNDSRFGLPTMSMNSLDKQFNHVAEDILPNFADEIQNAELPVLVYHNVADLKNTDSEWHNSTTTPKTFAMEMSWLKQNGYQVHSIGDLKWDGQKGEFHF